MKFKLSSVLLAAFMAVSVSAGTINVPTDYTTIQAAVDAAVDGDVINVAAGTYTGAIVDKEVTINGVGASINAGVPYKSGSGLTTAFRFDDNADGAKLTGFTIDCDASSSFYFAVFARAADDVVVDGLIVNQAVQGITNVGGSNWEVTNNGIYETGAASGGGIAISMSAYPPTYPVCSGNLIQNNTIQSLASAPDYSTPGILLGLDLRYDKYPLLTGSEDLTGNQILDNNYSCTGLDNEVGIEIGVNGLEGDPTKIAATLGIIHDNTVSGNIIDGPEYGIYQYTVSGLHILNNDIINCGVTGVHIEDGNLDNHVNYNNLSGNTVGITNNAIADIDASANWWGDIDPSDDISGHVDYSPWWGANYVADNHSSAWTWYTNDVIQDAIAAATEGDAINVADGTYSENIVVDKSLTIAGASQAGTIIIPAFSAPNPGGGGSLPDGSSNIVLVEADNVTIQDMTVDGDNPGLTSGIVHNGADIDARNGIITNHVAGAFDGLEVNNVLVKNIYLRGIYASTGGSFNISNNTVTNVNGEGASIAVMNWAGTGSFTGNTVTNSSDGIVSNHSAGATYSGNNVSSCGSGIHTDNNVTVADQILNNTVDDCGYGIFVFAPDVDVVVSGNTITNSDVGLCSAGSYSTTPLSVSFTNNVVDGQNRANSVGIYSTTEIWGFASGNQDASFTNNFIQNTANAVLLASEAFFANSTTAFENAITGNTLGVKLVNDITEAPPRGDFNLSMSCNWWGSDDAYDVQTAVGADIEFLPFLTNGTDEQAGIIGFQPVPNSCDGLFPVSCCIPPTVGDIDQSGIVDISDIQLLIDNQFITLTPLSCEVEGDTDLSGAVDITDISVLIDNQFLTLTPLPPCP